MLNRLDADESLKENTVVVYAADHGYFTGEHGYAEKRLMYEEALAFPLLMRWPGCIDGGTRIESLVQNIDLAPTFMEMAEANVPEDIQGRSLLPLLAGQEPPADWRTSIYYHYFDHMQHKVGRHAGVRTDRHKLIHFYTDDVWEFYDVESDPLEINNVYGQPEHTSEIASLKSEYERLKQQFDVPREAFEPPFEIAAK